ncbi:MAG: hypothetical protein MUC87_20560 [Bacteroidia bacterium]|jgi:hypothetical protein|nr:hypothetical protein [Bacteroidia bacterium]
MKPLGWVVLAFSALTAVFSTLSGVFQFIAMPMMLMGMGLSTIYLMLSTRHRVVHGYVHPGYIGLLLSSVPLLLILFFKFIR